ncbi:MAG: metal-dependent hydrolase [Micromonosporaceae bacterium]|jgi:membrane-bound metal-dependent hydrolase YbcI (DUF457 family)|nr:metal-dependent hydrolase [Micromonosporaceae bacterium]
MMGPSHALSGAAVWLAGSWALDHFAGYGQSPLAIAVGTAVCAGSTLLPDIDLSGRVTANRGGATVARTFGVVSLFLAEVVEKVSLAVYRATRTRRDPQREYGHRTLTHTLPFTGLLAWGTTALCAEYGKWAVIGVLFFTFGLALRGLLDEWAERAGWLVVTALSAAAAGVAFALLPAGRGYPMLGLAVGVGCLVHLVGDMLTSSGVPLLWPIPTGRRMWRMIGVPDAAAIRVGGRGERLLRVAFLVVCLAAAAAMFSAPIHQALDRVASLPASR